MSSVNFAIRDFCPESLTPTLTRHRFLNGQAGLGRYTQVV
jgi:hypothetical protein